MGPLPPGSLLTSDVKCALMVPTNAAFGFTSAFLVFYVNKCAQSAAHTSVATYCAAMGCRAASLFCRNGMIIECCVRRGHPCRPWVRLPTPNDHDAWDCLACLKFCEIQTVRPTCTPSVRLWPLCRDVVSPNVGHEYIGYACAVPVPHPRQQSARAHIRTRTGLTPALAHPGAVRAPCFHSCAGTGGAV